MEPAREDRGKEIKTKMLIVVMMPVAKMLRQTCLTKRDSKT